MPERIPVRLHAADPISRAGLASQVAPSERVMLADDDARTAVALVVVDTVDRAALDLVHVARAGGSRVVLVAAVVDERGLLDAVEAGACGVVLRQDATTANLEAAVATASDGGGSLPTDLLGRLLGEVGRLQRTVLAPHGLTMSGLYAREIAVLRLVADGYDTSEIATELAYSERTIKNVLHSVTTRFHLRNRSHAVAYALRQGLI